MTAIAILITGWLIVAVIFASAESRRVNRANRAAAMRRHPSVRGGRR